MTGALRVRQSLGELQQQYLSGNKAPLEAVMRAWKGIKDLPPDDPRSFYVLGGYHGEPFRGAGWGNSTYWGGYCMHGNVLFPTWHRVYLFMLEEAMRSIPGCQDVTLPFWDETDADTLQNGVPWALTAETFELDGQTIPNPLRSFVLPQNIVDHISGDSPNYSKAKGYETVRYPLSGLVGTDADKAKTAAHNAQWTPAQAVVLLNQNIVNWMTSAITVEGTPVTLNSIAQQFQDCLNAPNYTVFSNTSSRDAWNDNAPVAVQALEQPHNNIHLAVGGFEIPNFDASPIDGANGDMGENDTAALDPIFYFHHCNIDRVFWLWQKKNESSGWTKQLEVIAQYPGTNSVDNQGATPGVAPNSWLDMETPLDPFRKADGTTYTSNDCVDIEGQLGYTYGPGSLDDAVQPTVKAGAALHAAGPQRKIHVSGINRGTIRGSFLISAFVNVDGKRHHIGTEGVLSRWHVEGCANCQTHLQARATFPLHPTLAARVSEEDIEVEVRTRDGKLGGGLKGLVAAALGDSRPFRVELR